MSDVIQLLPDSVANQIAAGEVIQRPASVIKELVENAVDAGAQNIKVLVVDAGRTSIQVIDDGCGMSDTDARLSFERHATSKIRKASDLFELHTMGFRGEALASIAAVAQVTLQTRTADDEIGTLLRIAGSRVISQEPVSCPKGCNFNIENLFYNVPARRKFLKSNATEMSNITQAFERIVLVYPEISFELYNNGQLVLDLRATTLLQRILDLFGKRQSQTLLPLEAETTLCKLKGFVSKPEASKKKGANQFFFVNGRFMKHPYFHKAVMTAFDRLIPAGEQIPYYIYMEVPAEDIDVNIHPVKTEIKFENEQAIWQILLAAVRDAVGKFDGLSTIDFDTEGLPDIPVYDARHTGGITPPSINTNPQYNPFKSTPAQPAKSADGWEKLYTKLRQATAGQGTMHDQPEDLFPTEETTGGIRKDDGLSGRSDEHYQYRGSYIITQAGDGLIIIDQHRAHQRILFEEYMQQLKQHTVHTQKILFPDVVQFPPSYIERLPDIIAEMNSIGFDLTDIGGASYSITGVPGGLEGLDSVTLVSELVDAVIEQRCTLSDEINRTIAIKLSDKAAMPYGEVLSNEEMEHLISQLQNCEVQNYTPDGKAIITLINNNEIEKRFH